MTSVDIPKVAKDWIAYQKANEHTNTGENDPAFAVAMLLMDLTSDDWQTALAICVEIADQSDDPWILEILGAGPLEDLERMQGIAVLPGFLAAARANPRFRRALHHVWEGGDPRVWEQFVQIRDRLEAPTVPGKKR